MKKFLFLNFILFGFINLLGQNAFNRAYHDKHESLQPFLLEINEDYYFTTEIGDGSIMPNYGKCFLYRHDKNGNLKLRQQILNVGIPYFCASFKTLDDKIIFIGNLAFCDVMDSSYVRSFITKIDTNGNSLFYTPVNRNVPYNGWYLTDGFKTGLQHPDSSYYAFSDSVMYHFSKTGTVLTKKNLGIKNISSVRLLQNGNFILSATSGNTNYLFEFNISGGLISQTSIPILFSKMQFYSGQKILGLGAGKKLYKISTNHQLIDSSSFGSNVKDFLTENDTIYSINYLNATNMYRVSDTIFGSISQSTTNTQRVSQEAICKKGSKISIVSNCYSSSTFSANNTFASINVINSNGSNNFANNDAKLLSVIPDSMICIYFGGQYYSKIRAKVKVKNIGLIVLNNVKLNFFQTLATCGSVYWQKLYSNLALNPGDSVELMTDLVTKASFLPGPVQSTISSQFCFYTTLPNSENDKDISNDGLCVDLLFNPVSIKENEKFPFNFKLFPNPFERVISVECDIEIEKIGLYNALGVLLKNCNLNAKRYSFECSDLAPGIYFIKIETEKGILFRKVLKE